MHVLIVTQHYPPEVTAGAFRLESFAGGLAERGHRVTVVCAAPNHPLGTIADGYRRPLTRRRVSGVEVRYAWIFTRPRKTTAVRLGTYGSFALAAAALGVVGSRPDVVLASSPPLFVGAAGAFIAKRFGAPLVFDVRDLWPQSAVVLGELQDGRIVRLAERLERGLYSRAAAITTPNDAFRRHIAARVDSVAKIEVVANGTTRMWIEAGDARVDRAELGLPGDQFIWAYSGNVGLAHALDVALDAAELLGEGHRLIVIGHGPRLDEIERRAARLAPGTVELKGLMVPGMAARHLRACDALLVSERQESTVSAKLYDYAAVGRPIVAAARGEMLRLIEEERLALPVAPGDPAALADAIRRVRADASLAASLSENARNFALGHLRDAEAQRMADLLGEVAQAGRYPST